MTLSWSKGKNAYVNDKGTSCNIILSVEAVQPGGWCAYLEIRKILGSRPALATIVEFDSGSTWFIFSAALVNRELVCLRPVVFVFAVLSFRSLCFIGPEKPLWGVIN